jgi:hypothetical protein
MTYFFTGPKMTGVCIICNNKIRYKIEVGKGGRKLTVWRSLQSYPAIQPNIIMKLRWKTVWRRVRTFWPRVAFRGHASFVPVFAYHHITIGMVAILANLLGDVKSSFASVFNAGLYSAPRPVASHARRVKQVLIALRTNSTMNIELRSLWRLKEMMQNNGSNIGFAT